MTPDDLEGRLRRAFDEVSAGWQPNGGSAAELVSAVRRHRATRHRRVVTIGCAVAAVLALVVGAGAYSASKTDTRVASSAGPHGPTPSTGSAAAARPRLPNAVAEPPQRTNGTWGCTSVTAGSGVSRCAGVYLPTSTSSGFSAENAPAATASSTSTSASVAVRVGQRVTVDLPTTTSGTWSEPVVADLSRLPATLRQQLPVLRSPAHPGVVRVVGGVRGAAKHSVTAAFEATNSGDVVLTATLTDDCARPSNRPAGIVSPSCPGTSAQWVLLLVVSPR